MAQLIQMRQQIKAIESIKKITHAMRLISMSTHSRIKNKLTFLQEYKQAVTTIFQKAKVCAPEWDSPIIHPTRTPESKELIILVGSQKGLCGNFNYGLFQFFEKKITKEDLQKAILIAVGKKAVDYIKDKKKRGTLVATYPEFTSVNALAIAKGITEIIISREKPYASVTIFSNELKTFFLQKPYMTTLIPFAKKDEEQVELKPAEFYAWEQPSTNVLDILAYLFIEANIHYLLFQSLIAEQAARFLSMDSSTRNAEKTLEIMQLQYNKLRQAKVTKELTELAGSL